MPPTWPATAHDLAREQDRLARRACDPWVPAPGAPSIGACAVVFGRFGRDELGWAAAVAVEAGEVVATSTYAAPVAAPFERGQLALREGPILEAVVRGLPRRPEVLLVVAAGRDHPRRAGLALQLGAVLDLPTVGVTDDPLLAMGGEPAPERGSLAPLRLAGELVAHRVRTRSVARPVVAHSAWRTSADVAAELVLRSSGTARWPEPIRAARRLARDLRHRSSAATPGVPPRPTS